MPALDQAVREKLDDALDAAVLQRRDRQKRVRGHRDRQARVHDCHNAAFACRMRIARFHPKRRTIARKYQPPLKR